MGETLSAQGHCACGALAYTLTLAGPPRLSAFCHCTRCQRFNGAPYVHTLHLPYAAVQWHPAPAAPPPRLASELLRDDEERAQQRRQPDGAWSAKMHVFEAMEERKWKLRCSDCGSPMGSWNAAKGQWSIWRPTLARKPAPGEEGGARSHYTGAPDAPEALLQLLRPTHHQFYGAWRAVDVADALEKWEGYQGQSQRVG